MASDDRRSDDPADARSRFTTRTFLMPDDEPGDGASIEHDVPEEAFGTGGVDDDALDALVRGEAPAADVDGGEEEGSAADGPSALAAPLETADPEETRPFDLSEFDAGELEALSDDVIPEALSAEAFGFVDPPARTSEPAPYEPPVPQEAPAAESAPPDESDPLVAPLAEFDDAFGSPSAFDEPTDSEPPSDVEAAEPDAGVEPERVEPEAEAIEAEEVESDESEASDDDPLLTIHSVSEPTTDAAADDLTPIEARLVQPGAESTPADSELEQAEAEAADVEVSTSEPEPMATGADLVELDPDGADPVEAEPADPFGRAELELSADLDDAPEAFGTVGAEADGAESQAMAAEDADAASELAAPDFFGEAAAAEDPSEPEAAVGDPGVDPVADALAELDEPDDGVALGDLESALDDEELATEDVADPEPSATGLELVNLDSERVEEDDMGAADPFAHTEFDSVSLDGDLLTAFVSQEPDDDEPADEAVAPVSNRVSEDELITADLTADDILGGAADAPETEAPPEAPAEEAFAEAALADDDEVTDGAALAEPAAEAEILATAAVDGAFEAETDAAKADAVAGELDGTLDVAPLGPEDFEPDDLRGVLRTMLLSRQLDKKMLTLLKQGKGFFHIGSAGHEASQTAVAREFEGGHDWFCFYYRDLATALTVGITPAEVLRAHFGKADDVFGGGRQMPEHFGKRALNIMSTSSSVAAQYLPAVGFALAVKREDGDAAEEGRSRAVYAAGGEGSTSQGAFHEALNWAAREALPVLFHIQDNKYAISVPVEEQTAGGSIWHLLGGYAGLERIRYDGTDFFQSAAAARAAMAHIRAGKGPVALHADLVRLLPHSSSDDHRKYREQEAIDADAARDPIPQFAARLVDAGVMTDDEVDALREEVAAEVDRIAREVAAEPDPDPAEATTHVVYEGDDARQYELDGETGDLVVMVDAINHAMAEEMERDDRVLVYGEDVGGGKGGVFTATRGLTERFGRGRCFNSPLAENSIIGSAVGLAAAGYKPVVEIQFADYIWPGMQPLRNQVASMRYRSKGEWACPMVLRVPCGGYIHGGLCHSQNVEALFAHFPGLQVVLPSNAADAKGLLKTAIRGEDPVLFLEHKALYRQGPARRPEPHADYLVPLGKAAVARPGTDLTIVTWGAIVYKALNAAKALEKEGVSVEVIDVRSILPFDAETVLRSVKKTGRVLIAYEDHEFMGFGAEIAAQIADDAFGHLDAPVKRVAGAFSSIPYADALEKVVLPQDDDVLDAARDLLSY